MNFDMAKRKGSVPEKLKKVLPLGAQKIYAEVYAHAYENYDKPSKRRGDASREETASRVAWSAVKKKYEKSSSGKWVKK